MNAEENIDLFESFGDDSHKPLTRFPPRFPNVSFDNEEGDRGPEGFLAFVYVESGTGRHSVNPSQLAAIEGVVDIYRVFSTMDLLLLVKFQTPDEKSRLRTRLSELGDVLSWYEVAREPERKFDGPAGEM